MRTSKNREVRTIILIILCVLISFVVIVLVNDVFVYLTNYSIINKSLTEFILMNYLTLIIICILSITLVLVYFKVSINISRRGIVRSGSLRLTRAPVPIEDEYELEEPSGIYDEILDMPPDAIPIVV